MSLKSLSNIVFLLLENNCHTLFSKKKKEFIIFIYFLSVLSLHGHRLSSSCGEWRVGTTLHSHCLGFSLQWLGLLQSTGSRVCGLQ